MNGTSMGKKAKLDAASLARKMFDPEEWRADLTNAVLPILARRMGEAATAHLMSLGIDPRRKGSRKGTKHLPGQHDQSTHGSGGGGGGNGTARQARINELKDLKHERAIIVDSVGNEKRVDGGEYNVDVLPEAFPDEIEVWHNHPDGSPLSVNDLRTLMTRPARELYAVMPSGRTLGARKTKKSDEYEGDVDQDARTAMGSIRQAESDWGEVHDGPMPDRLWHSVLRSRTIPLAKRWGLKLTSEKASEEVKYGSSQVKASTAAEWVEEQSEEWEALEEAFAASGVQMGVLAELPQLMKDKIAERLSESFSQDYWDKISETTMGNAETVLRRGLDEGWSIRDMAVELREYFEEGGFRYARARSENIARTESGGALNGARKDSVARLQEDLGDRVPIKQSWLSVLGNTTRAEHADLDGVPEDENGMWNLGGIDVPWPRHIDLAVEQRANCQCSLTIEFGIREDEAQRLIEDYWERVEGYEGKTLLDVWRKHLPGQHDQSTHGSGGGGGMSLMDVRSELLGFDDGVEHSILLDGSGSVIGRNAGDEESVGSFQSDRLRDSEERLVEHHSHPFDSPPSLSDVLRLAENPGLAEVWAHSDEASYGISAVGDRRELYFAAKDSYGNARSELVERYFIEPGQTPPSREQISKEQAEMALSDLQGQGLIAYQRVGTSGEESKKGIKASTAVESKHLPGRHDQGAHGRGGGGGERARAAKRTHKPSTAEKQRLGEAEQLRLSKAVEGRDTGNNKPFDVRKGKHAIEVKTVMDNDNDKITVHPESRRRKERVAKEEGLKIHTVVIDVRGGGRTYYYKEGVGAFRLSSMEQVSLSQLKERFD